MLISFINERENMMLILATETSDRRLRSLRLKMAKSLKPLSLFLSWLIFFLSPLSASVVTHLPGFDGALPFYLETGYVGVDEANGGELFYYFIESEGNPRDDPLFLWLTGGPRCSAFSGLAFEVGPLKFVTAEYNGSLPSLVYHPYSWTKVANMIFLDSPLGSGFSFAKNIERYYADDISWSEHAYKFLIKWFNDHPQFLSNPLYIAGDSYAGKIVPIVTQLVLDGIDAGKQPQFNLQGYIIGNPSTGERVDENSRVPFAHGMAIISNSFYKLTQRSCQGQDYTNPTNAQCASCLDTFDQIVSEINRPQILELKCIPEYFEYFMPRIRNQDRRILKEKLNLFAPPPFPDIRCRSYAYVLSYYWANNVAVRQALHIKEVCSSFKIKSNAKGSHQRVTWRINACKKEAISKMTDILFLGCNRATLMLLFLLLLSL
ncbi:serine carboxypeptidase-like 12 [Canna indica]|uniref:Serine carboxypeptidase-like 12 n=1 Tax=Canna indica TaxID=4628 RepID=A0AAQ3JSI8_9LILI|nr:serine carboxypeptidase-like 12 [Canna indica]